MLLKIDHITRYEYSKPVKFGTHRLMLRPLEGHDVQIRSSALEVRPAGRIRWAHDIFDNSVAFVEFKEPAAELFIRSSVVVKQYNTNPFDFILEDYARILPFTYTEQEWFDANHYMRRHFPQDEAVIRNWIRPFLDIEGRASTFDFLNVLNKSVPGYFDYERREEPGVQAPGQTLKLRKGSCRDFALLLMETARQLGLASRFVSGYLCNTTPGETSLDRATGATHAWTEIYLPGAGWKGFDPTGGVLAAEQHVRAAVAREPHQAAPISGSFLGDPSLCTALRVDVKVERVAA